MRLSPFNVGWPCCSFLNLDAAYRFASAPTQGDDSKNSYDLTEAGTPAYDGSGKNGGCMQFIDSADAVSNADLLDSSDFSACGWFKCDTTLSTGEKVYPFLFDDTSSGGADTGMVFNHGGTDSLFRAQFMINGSASGLLFSGSTFDLSDFVFWAITVDHSGGLYVRVNSNYALASATAISHTGGQTFRSQPNEDGYTLTAELDELYIDHGTIWTAAQLDQLYNSGTGKFVDASGEF